MVTARGIVIPFSQQLQQMYSVCFPQKYNFLRAILPFRTKNWKHRLQSGGMTRFQGADSKENPQSSPTSEACKKRKFPKKLPLFPSDPGGIQTHDLQNRNLTLYSAKLRDQNRMQIYRNILNPQILGCSMKV